MPDKNDYKCRMCDTHHDTVIRAKNHNIMLESRKDEKNMKITEFNGGE